uniref:Glutathione S-transferase n=1 Tax=Palpitomonas bilix TaxID=652834 RepID=A0A7S3LV15_9EUKA|mmetsp:Transcript_48897/g.126575  ORF Transcript_48897/g.126575 Transcript_48897/m.126575 type:complete len:121 (+) Transcript_48897:67-429(+)
MARTPTAFRLCSNSEWQEFEAKKEYDGTKMDKDDGFIHLSTAAETRKTASLYFKGSTDLYYFEVDLAQLGDNIKWDMVEKRQAEFPHVYNTSIPLSAVLSHGPIPVGDDKEFVFPPSMSL